MATELVFVSVCLSFESKPGNLCVAGAAAALIKDEQRKIQSHSSLSIRPSPNPVCLTPAAAGSCKAVSLVEENPVILTIVYDK